MLKLLVGYHAWRSGHRAGRPGYHAERSGYRAWRSKYRAGRPGHRAWGYRYHAGRPGHCASERRRRAAGPHLPGCPALLARVPCRRLRGTAWWRGPPRGVRERARKPRRLRAAEQRWPVSRGHADRPFLTPERRRLRGLRVRVRRAGSGMRGPARGCPSLRRRPARPVGCRDPCRRWRGRWPASPPGRGCPGAQDGGRCRGHWATEAPAARRAAAPRELS